MLKDEYAKALYPRPSSDAGKFHRVYADNPDRSFCTAGRTQYLIITDPATTQQKRPADSIYCARCRAREGSLRWRIQSQPESERTT